MVKPNQRSIEFLAAFDYYHPLTHIERTPDLIALDVYYIVASISVW